MDPSIGAAPRVVELFAGVGGFRLGLERSGWQVVWADQWEPGARVQHASECYARHFRSGTHVNEDIEAVLDQVAAGEREIPDHDLLVGGFPCFAAGTMVLTATGHRPIEEVRVGDLVLTHLGRWRRVARVMNRAASETLVLRGHGFPDIRTTAEHPFWALRRGARWDALRRRTVRAFGEPAWIPASQIDSTVFVSQAYPKEHPDPPVQIDRDLDFYWIVGRYLADGWRATPNGKGRVVICAAHGEADEVERRIRRVYPCTRSVERTVVKFHVTRSALYDWLEDFGAGAAGKRIPGWLLGISREQARALLDGYRSGDGSTWQGGWRATTVSRALALGIGLLAQHAHGVVASIHEASVAATTTIEGRTVNQRHQYQMVIPPRNRSAFVSGTYGWKLVRGVRTDGPATVFNLSVEEDESYTADGCVVHNCQDYSVARTLNQAAGIIGRKGVLWWQIHRLLAIKRPPLLFLENVDRLLKSPAKRRGRDFAIMLTTLANLGYDVEWRVVNAADYGFPQKRRRIFIVGRQATGAAIDPNRALHEGVLGRALPVRPFQSAWPEPMLLLDPDPVVVSETFGLSGGRTPFLGGGFMSRHGVWTVQVHAAWPGPRQVLGDILEPDAAVAARYRIPAEQVEAWAYLKGAKRERRIHKGSGTPYFYAEGRIPFPDPTDRPARTILTGEGGATPSRFKHVVQMADGRLRRLTPRELERLNGFPDDWTAGMAEGRRAFTMGNSLVVGLVERVGRELLAEIPGAGRAHPAAVGTPAPADGSTGLGGQADDGSANAGG